MTKNISITLNEDLLSYLDELAEINGRTRSAMISWLIKKSYDEDKALEENYRANYPYEEEAGDL